METLKLKLKKIKDLILYNKQSAPWTDVDEFGKPIFRIKSNGPWSKQVEITYGGYEFKYVKAVNIFMAVGKPISATIEIIFPEIDINLDEDNLKE